MCYSPLCLKYFVTDAQKSIGMFWFPIYRNLTTTDIIVYLIIVAKQRHALGGKNFLIKGPKIN